jgi:hypothetical protein
MDDDRVVEQHVLPVGLKPSRCATRIERLFEFLRRLGRLAALRSATGMAAKTCVTATQPP